MTCERYALDDLYVGLRFTSDSQRLDATDIKKFASRFDPQPFHLDEAAAGASIFAGLAASGWQTAAITMRLLVEGGLPIEGGLIGTGAQLSWPRPVRPGDVLTVESEIVKITPSRSRPNRGMVEVRSETRNEKGDLVLTLTSTLMVTGRNGPDATPGDA